MEQEALKKYLFISNEFKKLSELGKFLSSLNAQIEIYGDEITIKDLRDRLVNEFCEIDERLRTYCKDINL